ncbi:MAG: leucine--tRNA ligase [Dehalococcoidia bacterium]|nr:leucine--tRNA ligase [Dehalococcoidia bacterium]
MTSRYKPQELEQKWQARWETSGLYRVTEESRNPKFYSLTMFPYTSGDLHVGHWYAMAPSDTFARFVHMKGYNVLHPIGFDAFGLPAENAAIKSGIHPAKWTMANVQRMRNQLKTMGSMYDWDREVITCLPEYYKWTQWLFLHLYKGGLAYRAKAPANWCPHCQTVLANEQVTDAGRCERCDAVVTKRDLEQWFFRITRFADELLDFSGIDWPERVRTMQRNWIGRSQGAEATFGIEGHSDEIKIFTTRPDTMFGVTFMVLAPEHPLVAELTAPDRRADVEIYVAASRRETEIDRLSTEREKTGVFIGAYAINNLNGERVPIWTADYVLMTYGTGAVMGVPGHDTRDFEFAKRFGLPIRVVIAPPGWQGEDLDQAYVEPGTMANSGQFNRLPSDQGKGAITDWLEEHGLGRRAVSYRIRDWLISRQRYWGAPIPVIYCEKCGIVPVPEDALPVLLPDDAEFRPTGESPLVYHQDFVNTTCPKCHGLGRRETDTMDTFLCSSWYFLRYASPQYEKGPYDREKGSYWLPVDVYTGGVEHATMHLLYARFFIKALKSLGIVDFNEPFTRLFNQGTITYDHRKMSKSRGNVVNPDDYVATMGADTVRAYLMFVGPWEQGGDWNDQGIAGINRWLNRVWRLVLDPPEGAVPTREEDEEEEGAHPRILRHVTHRTLQRVTEDLERFRFNTMLAAFMEFTNYLGKIKETPLFGTEAWLEAIHTLILMLAPATPHMAEELWERTGQSYSVHQQPWPAWDTTLAAEEEFTLVIQVNGKLRDRVIVPASIADNEVRELVMARRRVLTYLDGRDLKRFIYVPRRLVNLVIQ